MTTEWLLENVVPHLNHFYGAGNHVNNPALVLAYPLLWAAMSPEMEKRMDPEQRKRIWKAYSEIDTLPEGVNPVVRVHLFIGRVKDTLVIDETRPEIVGGVEMPTTAPTTGSPGACDTGHPALSSHGGGGGGGGVDRNFMEMMFSHHQQVMKTLSSQERANQTMIANIQEALLKQLETISCNLAR